MIRIEISEQVRSTYRKSDGIQVAWAWAKDQFGPPGWQGQHRWDFYERRTFLFAREEDAMWFRLKWT